MKKVVLRNVAYQWFYYKASEIPSNIDRLITKEMLVHLLTYYHKDSCLRDYTYISTVLLIDVLMLYYVNNKKIYDEFLV